MEAIAPFAAVLIAIVVLLLALAAWVFAELLTRALSNVPVVGGWIANNVRPYVIAAGSGIMTIFDSVTADAGTLLAGVVGWVWTILHSWDLAAAHAANMAAQGLQQADFAFNFAAAVATADAAAAVTTAERYAAALAANAVTVADNLYNSAIATINADIKAAEAAAGALFATAVGDVNALANTVAADVRGLEATISQIQAALTGDVSALVSTIVNDLNKALTAAEADAAAALQEANTIAAQLSNTAAAAAVSVLDQTAYDLVIGPWSALIPEVKAIIDGIPAAEAAALGLLGAIDRALPDTIPGILSLVVPAVAAVAAEVADCLIPNCKSISQLQRLVTALSDGALWGLMIALLIEAARNPRQAADDLAGLTTLAKDAWTGLADLVGV